MKAIRIHAFGGPETLQLDTVPDPTPGPGEALIAVAAASVNPVDWKIREGFLQRFMPVTLPHTLGVDLAGTVIAVGPDTDLAPGDRVAGNYGLADPRAGAYAERATIDASTLARLPDAVDFVAAAALPVAGLTAYQALIVRADLSAGQRVLIHAAAGGVGTYAVQLARAVGAEVIGTASAGNREFVESLGAHRVIDYRNEAFESVVGEVDVVLDTVAGETLARSYGIVRRGGWLLSVATDPDPAQMAARDLRGEFFLVSPSRAQLTELAARIADHSLRSIVSQTFPLAETRAAHDQSQTGHTRGKLVLTVG
jgi:NADPH:quinone reductase-like Zn-dependent oxidoreductase